LASIAHEINNPLQAIQGCLTLVQEELEAENALGTPLKGVLGTANALGTAAHAGVRGASNAGRYLRIAESEITRLAAILKRVREFYRPAGLGWQPTDVRAVLSNVLELTGKQLQHSHVTVELDWGDGAERELMIRANPDHLKQIFLNLIINAIDAMALGTTASHPAAIAGGRLRISTALDYLVRADARVPAVRIEVADNGPGIEPEVLPRLFEPFFSARPGGAGLGLSICYSIIEAHQGRITVTSQPGPGTQFTIWLPAA
jgi:two-component system NtrC family sensor kinase